MNNNSINAFRYSLLQSSISGSLIGAVAIAATAVSILARNRGIVALVLRALTRIFLFPAKLLSTAGITE